jgi:lipopolysaccharide transport system ATP-binding protein
LRTSSDDPRAVALQVEGISKAYRIAGPHGRHDTLRDALMASFRAIGRGRPGARRERFWALRDVSFQVRQGENVGILGLNGAGKSTLLKVLSRITDPTAGRARITGRLGSLLEVGTGFHGELTGRENVFLYGAILGMTKAEIARKFDAITEFAGIGAFIDVPVKRYSSGMYVRLAFAVAAHLEPDILLLDEVLSVGDLPFQRKCMEFAKGLQRRNATILFVSHNMFSIKTMCDRVIYLRQGRVEYDGPTEGGIARYEADCQLSAPTWVRSELSQPSVTITEVRIEDEAGAPRTVFAHGERMRLSFAYACRHDAPPPNFIVAFIRSDGVACCNYSSELDGLHLGAAPQDGQIELLTPPLSLVSELYTIEILVRERGFQRLLGATMAGTFHVRDDLLDLHFGVFHEAGQWTLARTETAARVQPDVARALP